MSECQVCKTGEYKVWGLDGDLCEKHNVCVDCGIKRKDLKTTPWGVRVGAFLCGDCEVRGRKKRIAERQEKGFDTHYTDEIVCPECGYEFSDSWEYSNRSECEVECPECETEFTLKVNFDVTYTTEKTNDQR